MSILVVLACFAIDAWDGLKRGLRSIHPVIWILVALLAFGAVLQHFQKTSP